MNILSLSAFSNPFLVMALLAGLCASFAGGIVGTYVVVKRIVFISGSIAHAVLGGMGLALYLNRTFHWTWLHPMFGAFIFSLISAFLIGWVRLYHKEREDTVIASLWTSGMALGVIFLSLTPGYNVEVLNFLFGNILWSSQSDLWILLALDGCIAITVLILHKKFVAICFDEKQAKLQGLNTHLLYFILLSLIAMTVVLLIQVVGAILVIAILSLPSAMANRFTYRVSTMMMLAVVFGMALTFLGILASSSLNWPPGATISLVTTIGYFLSFLCRKKTI